MSVVDDLTQSATAANAHVPNPALPGQLQWLDQAQQVLARSGCSGERAVQALHVILTEHVPPVVADADGSYHLACQVCRPVPGGAEAQYPCTTATRALWALDALVH